MPKLLYFVTEDWFFVSHFLPMARVWYLNVLISLPIVLLVAAASWHFVERPAGGLRSVLKRWEERFLAIRGRRKQDAQAPGARAQPAELEQKPA